MSTTNNHLQQKLSEAHQRIADVIRSLDDVMLVTAPGNSLQGLVALQAQLERIAVLTLNTRQRMRAWGTRYGEMSTETLGELPTLRDIFPDDAKPTPDVPAAEAADESDEESDEERFDESDEEAEETAEDDELLPRETDVESDTRRRDAELDAFWGYDGYVPTTWRPGDQPIQPAILGDDVLAQLFGIAPSDAAAGVAETGYLNIFGDWVPGRRPGRYTPPANADTDTAADDGIEPPANEADENQPE